MFTISLDGVWELCCRPRNQWHAEKECCITAHVPGDVHLDLMQAGLIPEPLTGDNSLQMNWIEEKDWWYHKDFIVSRDALRNRAELVFEGIDLTADIWLNGEKLGNTNNMFREYRFDVTTLLREGINAIDVRLDVGLDAANDKPVKAFEACWNAWDVRRMWIRKAQQAFYWDITPRLHTCGLWRSVRLESFDLAVIRDVYVSSTVCGKQADIAIQIETETFGACADYSLSVVLKDENTFETAVQSFAADGAVQHNQTVQLCIPSVQLWWPRGLGQQHLYSVEICLMDSYGRIISKKTLRHGVRRVTIRQEDINEEESTFNILVNGEPVFFKGWDWVPPDAIYARVTPQVERRLLDMAAECHTNMLRVWGGGIYPTDEFYDYCDELGIMLWQDFMLACGYYPDFDAGFCKEFEQEAAYIIRKYRNHASLGLWCANNENQQMHEMTNPHGVHIGQRLYDEILAVMTASLDPNTPYHPGSPFYGKLANSNERGDQHIWDHSMAWVTNGKYQLRIWDFAEGNPKFVSEFGVCSPPNLATAKAYMNGMTPDMKSPAWFHHMCYFAVGLTDNLIKEYYTDRPVTDLAEYTMAGQMIQAEAISDVVKTLRTRKFICGGVLYWQFAESWGHTGYSPVDYYLRCKASYYYMKRAFEPVTGLFAENGNQVVLVNDTLEPVKLHAECGVMRFEGEKMNVQEGEITLAPNSVTPFAEVDCAHVDGCNAFAYVILKRNGREIARNRRFLAPMKTLHIPAESLHAEYQRLNETEWKLTLTADVFHWDVTLEQDDRLKYSDNAFDVWPGERKVLYITANSPLICAKPAITSINHYRGGMTHG